MDFKCKQLSISDEDLGCTIMFYDTIDKYDESESHWQMTHSKVKYLWIQRSYAEDEDEIDWYSVETSESDIELNYKDKMYVKLKHDLFQIHWSGQDLIIGLNLTEKKFCELKRVLKNIFKNRVELL